MVTNNVEPNAFNLRPGSGVESVPGSVLRSQYLDVALASPLRLRAPEPVGGTLDVPPLFRLARTGGGIGSDEAAGAKRTATPSDNVKSGRDTVARGADTPPGAELIKDRTPLPRSRWTLAFDLTTSQSHARDDNSDERVTDGAEHKRQELLRLADQTRGTGLTMVVQATAADEDNSGVRRAANPRQLNTYIIHDGQIDELPQRASQGAEADLEGLMRVAGTLAPADRMALIAQAHGGGAHGLSGDTGNIPLDRLGPAISRGLAGTGRNQLDLVDFDACSMGQTEVARAMARVTPQMVASPEEEHSGGPHNDAQNVAAIVRALAANPQMDGRALGDEIVRLAQTGANGGQAAPDAQDRDHPGTPTLSHYDLTSVDRYSAAVNDLGTALTGALQNPNNRRAIEQVIAQTPLSTRAGARPEGTPEAEQRDTKLFATNLLAAVRSGDISDADGSIARAAQAVLTSQSDLVRLYHGERNGGYAEQGGLSIFLPQANELNVNRFAAQNNPLQSLAALRGERQGDKFGTRDFILEDIDYKLKQINEAGGPGSASTWQALEEARRSMSADMSSDDFAKSIARIRELARQAELTPQGQRLSEKYRREAQESIDRMISDQHIQSGSGWQQFIERLRETG